MAPDLLFVNHVGVVGGAEESLLVLLAALDRERFRPRLAAPPGELATRAQRIGISWLPLPPGRLRRGSARERWRSLAWLAAAAGRLAAAPADLIHANSAAAALAALPLAVSRRRPLVWHVRDVRLPPSAVAALAGTATAIAISDYVAAALLKAGWSPRRLAVIPNAIDPEAVQPSRPRSAVRAELGLGRDDELVIAVGQFVPWKRHDLLLDAIARLAPTRPRLRVVLVGDDRFGEHPELLARYRAAAASPPLAGRVVLTGQRSDVPDLLAAADIMVLPSAGEPFGRVVLEAMAVGLPQVVTAPSGAAEVMLPGVTGLLVPHGQPVLLAGALRSLLDNPERRMAMGRASLGRVRQFRPTASAAEVMALYDRLGRRSGGGRECLCRGGHDAC